MKGNVYIVGAGCGDSDLITVRGLTKLLSADVVLYDSLVSPDLLDSLTCEKICVGKRFNKPSMPQDEINNLMLSYSEQGKKVVRLKGGDPFLFGRGGEEVIFLKENNIDYEIIPGISSVIAVPELAGIPVTHRELSRNLTILTASSIIEGKESITEIDYASLIKLKGTIVILMGLHHIEEILNKFIEYNMPVNTPCAIISNGCTKNQKITRGTISNIDKNMESPAIIVVGECAGMDLMNKRKNKKVIVTGTNKFFNKLSKALKVESIEVVDNSFLDIKITEENLPDIKNYDWVVFTSPNGVNSFFIKMEQEKLDVRCLSELKFAVIGIGTYEELQKYGIYADLIPDVYDSKSLANKIVNEIDKTQKILLCRASVASEELIEGLTDYNYLDYSIYELIENKEKKAKIHNISGDYIVFASASGVRHYMDNFKSMPQGIKIICMGERCALALKEYNIDDYILPKESTVESIVDLIKKDC